MELRTETTQTENQELALALQAGDETAFAAIANRYRAELRVHCYRMLGSLADSEDLVQETLLKAWRARAGFEGRSALRSWLYRIATNACLDYLDSRTQRQSGKTVTSAQPELGSQPHVPWLQPYPDRLLDEVTTAPDARLLSRETLELGYMVAIQCLAPKQRAVLICCDVLEWSAKETAELLSLSLPAVNSALQRARAVLQNQKETGAHMRHAVASDEQERALLDGYVKATEQLDLAALTQLLREDLRFSMPPDAFRGVGRDTAIQAWTEGGFGSPDCRDFRCVITRVNRLPAVAAYCRRAGAERYLPMALDVLTLSGGQVAEITTFDLTPLLDELALPREL